MFCQALTRKKAYTDLTKLSADDPVDLNNCSGSDESDVEYYSRPAIKVSEPDNSQKMKNSDSMTSLDKKLIANEFFYNINLDDDEEPAGENKPFKNENANNSNKQQAFNYGIRYI